MRWFSDLLTEDEAQGRLVQAADHIVHIEWQQGATLYGTSQSRLSLRSLV